MAEVELKNIEKRYSEDAFAVKGISFRAKDGEFVVLVGPSGCGKSTTLRMIAGLEDATSGDISIGGKIVNDLEPKDRDIAMVFQNYALYPHMTVAENMAFQDQYTSSCVPMDSRRTVPSSWNANTTRIS